MRDLIRLGDIEVVENKEALRQEISQDVQAYMAKGGKITQLPSDFAEQPVKPRVNFNDLMGWV